MRFIERIGEMITRVRTDTHCTVYVLDTEGFSVYIVLRKPTNPKAKTNKQKKRKITF